MNETGKKYFGGETERREEIYACRIVGRIVGRIAGMQTHVTECGNPSCDFFCFGCHHRETGSTMQITLQFSHFPDLICVTATEFDRTWLCGFVTAESRLLFLPNRAPSAVLSY